MKETKAVYVVVCWRGDSPAYNSYTTLDSDRAYASKASQEKVYGVGNVEVEILEIDI